MTLHGGQGTVSDDTCMDLRLFETLSQSSSLLSFFGKTTDALSATNSPPALAVVN